MMVMLIDPPPNEGGDMADVVGRERAEQLLRWLGKDRLRPMEETMRDVCDSFLQGRLSELRLL